MNLPHLKDNYMPVLVGFTAALSLLAWYVAWSNGWVLAYNDAMSHLNISRLVIDNKNPGLAQLGSVWPPFSHIVTLPLIWIDSAWRSGFAGSLASMIAYVATVISVHGIVYELTKKRIAAVLAAIAAAFNINFLYLQSTPLTEVLYVALFSGSIYFLIKYVKDSKPQHLLPLTLLTVLQMITRYDGWFFALAAGLILLIHEVYTRRQSWSKAIGCLSLFALPVIFTALLWFTYNAVIFNDPLFFARGSYSAQAQQQSIESSAGLITKHDLVASYEAFGYTVGHNIGWVILLLGLVGWLAYLHSTKLHAQRVNFIALSLLLSILVFNVIALFLGFSIINVPELNWNPFGPDVGRYFNVRYGIMALPFATVGIGLLSSKWRFMTPILLVVILAQSAHTAYVKPIALIDGLEGASAYTHDDVASALRKNVKDNDDVLVSFFSFPAAAHQSNLELKQFIHEGVGDTWQDSLKRPEQEAEWLLMSRVNASDPVYSSLVNDERGKFKKHFKLVHDSDNGQLYRRLDVASKNSTTTTAGAKEKAQ